MVRIRSAQRHTVVPMGPVARDDGRRNKLREAVLKKDYSLCESLISDGHDVRYIDSDDGSTLLHILANKFSKSEKRAAQIPSLLLLNGADINAKDKHGDTPLHIAARRDIDNLCSILIQHLRDNNMILHINDKNNDRMMPLHCAAKEGHNQITEMLLNDNADACCKDSKKYLPLHYAAMGGHYECCQLLAPHYPDDRQIKITPIHLAARGGYDRCLHALKSIKDRIDLDAKDHGDNAAIHLVVKEGSEKGLKILLEMGASHDVLSKSGNTPLMIAVKRNKVGCLKILMEARASMMLNNKAGQNVLHIAAFGNCEECMEYLLKNPQLKEKIDEKDENGVTPLDAKDNDGLTPLAVAIKRQHYGCAEKLLQNGSSATVVVGKKSNSLLHLAAQNTTSEMLRLLPLEKLDVDQRNCDGKTPLHQAAEKGSVEACLWLLNKGANINACDQQQKTALHLSASHGHLQVLRGLLMNNDINTRLVDYMKSTALHVSAEKGHLECCKALLDKDSGLGNEQNVKKMFAVTYAIANNHRDVVKFLIEHMPFKDISDLRGREREKQQKVQELFSEELHTSSHKALYNKNKEILEVITESTWWEAGFGPRKHGLEPCPNFRDLVKQHPDLAATVMDRCLPTKKSSQYDFRLLEDNFYVKDGSSPFEESLDNGHRTAKLRVEAEELRSDGLEWKKFHPVTIMIHQRRRRLLQHPLVEAWLNHKWWRYARRVVEAALILQTISVVLLVCFIYYVKNWNQINHMYGMTEEEFCNESLWSTTLEARNIVTYANQKPKGITPWNPGASLVLHILLILSVIIQSAVEVFKYQRLKTQLVDRTLILRLPCIISTIVMLLPLSHCEFTHGIKSVIIWEFGVVALVLSCFLLIQVLSYLPQFSLLSIITWDFLVLYAKGVIFLMTILVMFAVLFNVILEPGLAFVSFWQSLVKMFVWLAGDYNFDSTFIETPLSYPILSNILFLVFIITVGGLLVLLLKSPSTSESEILFLRKARRANFLLDIDICIPWAIRRKFVFAKIHTDHQVTRISRTISRFLASYIPCLKDNPEFSGEREINYFVSGDEFDEEENPQAQKLSEVLAQCDRLANVFQKLHSEVIEMKRLHEEVIEIKKTLHYQSHQKPVK